MWRLLFVVVVVPVHQSIHRHCRHIGLWRRIRRHDWRWRIHQLLFDQFDLLLQILGDTLIVIDPSHFVAEFLEVSHNDADEHVAKYECANPNPDKHLQAGYPWTDDASQIRFDIIPTIEHQQLEQCDHGLWQISETRLEQQAGMVECVYGSNAATAKMANVYARMDRSMRTNPMLENPFRIVVMIRRRLRNRATTFNDGKMRKIRS